MVYRILVNLGVVPALLISLLILIGTAATYKPGVAVPCIDNAEDRARLKRLSIRALDDAYEAQLEHLFEIWMRDSRDQPRRAQAGASNAIAAWAAVRQSMNKFEPPQCDRSGEISK